MSECKFKVGRTYNTRGGDTVLVINFDPNMPAKHQLVIRNLSRGDGTVGTRYADGSFFGDQEDSSDVLLRTTKLYGYNIESFSAGPVRSADYALARMFRDKSQRDAHMSEAAKSYPDRRYIPFDTEILDD